MTKNTSMSFGDHFDGSIDQNIESGRCGSASEVVRLEDRDRQVAALREALFDGENSGEADELDMKKTKAKARQRASR